MNKYQYKDLDYAKEILDKGFTSKFILSELRVLAKYYKSLDRANDEIKELIWSFCKNNLEGFNEAVHFKVINNAANFIKEDKNKLIQIDEVHISKSELEYVLSLDIEYDYKKVVFTLLVLSKLEKIYLQLRDGELKSKEYYFGGHKNYRNLVGTSKITFDKKKASKVKNIHDLIRVFNEKGIIEITHNGNIKLQFMYDIKQSDDVVISVKDYSLIGYYLDLHCEENKVKECEICYVPIKANSSTSKYCKVCSKEKERERQRDKWHRNKDKYRATYTE